MKTPELAIEKNLWIDADPDVVFDMLTSAAHIVEYFPLDEVVSSWTAGGDIVMQGTANGEVFVDRGVIREIERPRILAYTYWNENHGTTDDAANHISIRYELRPDAVGTRLRLVQGNLPSEDYRDIMDDAWDTLLGSLKAYVESQ